MSCRRALPLADFGLNRSRLDGLQQRCRSCRNREARESRLVDPEPHRTAVQRHAAKIGRPENLRASHAESAYAYRNRNPEKRAAHNAVQRALRDGTLRRPGACSRCGRQCKPHAHHPDHSLWLSVVWLCSICHAKEH